MMGFVLKTITSCFIGLVQIVFSMMGFVLKTTASCFIGPFRSSYRLLDAAATSFMTTFFSFKSPTKIDRGRRLPIRRSQHKTGLHKKNRTPRNDIGNGLMYRHHRWGSKIGYHFSKLYFNDMACLVNP
jgi:hypothetical protein